MEFSEHEIQAVISALEDNEYALSDGFGNYVVHSPGEQYNSEGDYIQHIRKVAIDILRKTRQPRQP